VVVVELLGLQVVLLEDLVVVVLLEMVVLQQLLLFKDIEEEIKVELLLVLVAVVQVLKDKI
tara:strand:- start:298 stop:480 length:183 start_codon:yes stop_codon:yes gene_type:complete